MPDFFARPSTCLLYTSRIQGQNNVAFENSIAAPVPTGIFMDILPYIVLAAVVLAGVITLVIVHFKRKGPHNKDIWDE